jgi:glycosyltransferase involved in cell wall biosynthesis
MDRLRVAICADFPEERWPSMDRVASMLCEQLTQHHADAFEVDRICPPFVRAATRVPLAGRSKAAFDADRFLNRFWSYPNHIEPLAARYDLFHIVDHSYAHLAHALPASRTVVTCHDLDAFRSVLDPTQEPRSGAFRTMTGSILTGLQRAAVVMCDTTAIRDELAWRRLIEPDRLVVASLGVDDVFFEVGTAAAERADAALTPLPADAIEILHVGSTVPRKRIDVLLRVCAALGRQLPQLRLTRVGEALTPDQQQVLRDSGMSERTTMVNDVDEATLAALYRRATLVLQPSEREGFGLPVIEALASGTPVVASDLPVLREVGGSAVEYCAVGDIDEWCRAVAALVEECREAPVKWSERRETGRRHARGFTWERFASDVTQVYRRVAGHGGLAPRARIEEACPTNA